MTQTMLGARNMKLEQYLVSSFKEVVVKYKKDRQVNEKPQ